MTNYNRLALIDI